MAERPDPLRLALLAAVLATAGGAGARPTAAQDWREFRVARQVHEDTRTLDVELLYGVGRFSVSPAEAGFLYDARLRYDAERFQPLRRWTVKEGRGRLGLALTSLDQRERPPTVRLDDWDVEFDLEGVTRKGNPLGRLDLRLAPDVPTRLEIRLGAADARLDLGGLSLESLDFGTGASETEIAFETPNRIPMRGLTLRAGAAAFEARELGNARFETMEFSGAIGGVLLDFSGEWERDASATVKMGVGELKIRVPRDLGVRIERKSFLIALDAEDFVRVDDAYISPNFDTAGHRLVIRLEAALGSVEIERI